MRSLDWVSGAILFLFGLVISLTALGYPLGSIRSPGAGFFPLLASVLLMALSAFLMIAALLRKRESGGFAGPFFPSKESAGRILFAFLALTAYRYCMPVLGFAPATLVFFFLLVRFLGHYRWGESLVFSSLAACGAYFLFQVWLKVQMPIGIFRI